MFARNVALRLKPNTLAEQKGFQDEIAFCNLGGMDVIAISLWDTQEHAEAYNTAGYPDVLKSLNKVLDGSPRVRVCLMSSARLFSRLALQLPPRRCINHTEAAP